MRLSFLLGALALGALAAPTATAQTTITDTNVHLIILGDESQDGTSKTAAKDEPVLVTAGVSPRAIRLKEDLTIGSLGTGVNFSAGDVMFGRYDDTVWTYCGIAGANAESRAVTETAAAVLTLGVSLLTIADRPDRVDCLHDANDDGVFDSAWGGGTATGENAMVVFDMSKRNMTTPVAYERIDPRDGPAMPVSITWRKGTGATILFGMDMGGKSVASESAAIPAAGADPSEVEIGGVKIMLTGYDATAETISLDIVEGFRGRYTRLPARRVIYTTYSYY